MNSSQHLLVLMSIILGFGIRELLVGGRAAAVGRPRSRLSFVPFLAGTLVLVAIVQFWWYLFIVANRGNWGGQFLSVRCDPASPRAAPSQRRIGISSARKPG